MLCYARQKVTPYHFNKKNYRFPISNLVRILSSKSNVPLNNFRTIVWADMPCWTSITYFRCKKLQAISNPCLFLCNPYSEDGANLSQSIQSTTGIKSFIALLIHCNSCKLCQSNTTRKWMSWIAKQQKIKLKIRDIKLAAMMKKYDQKVLLHLENRKRNK